MNRILGFLFLALASLNVSAFTISSIYDTEESSVEQACLATVFIAKEINYFESSFGADPYTIYKPFRFFYEWLYPTEITSGSGFLISSDGYIITNEHIVRDATTVMVVIQNPDLRICKARLIGSDCRSDIAVLKLEGVDQVGLPYLRLGNSHAVKLGDPILAIGNPKNTSLEATITKGVVSGKNRTGFFSRDIEGYIQTDASLNPGNSGGPILNSRGEVIAMSTWAYSHYFGNEGLGFGVTSDTIRLISEQLIKKGKISQGFLGVELDTNQESVLDAYYFDTNDGAFVVDVIQNSPAMHAGLQTGDLIVKINECEITCSDLLKDQIRIRTPNTPVTLIIDRDGEIIEMTTKLGSEELTKRYATYSRAKIVI